MPKSFDISILCLLSKVKEAHLLFPEAIFRIFSNDPAVVAMAREYLRIAVFMYFAFAMMAPPIGLSTGVGATGLNMAIALLDGVLARIGLSLLFGSTLDCGLHGFWIGNAMACYISVILPSAYFFFGKWKDRKLWCAQLHEVVDDL